MVKLYEKLMCESAMSRKMCRIRHSNKITSNSTSNIRLAFELIKCTSMHDDCMWMCRCVFAACHICEYASFSVCSCVCVCVCVYFRYPHYKRHSIRLKSRQKMSDSLNKIQKHVKPLVSMVLSCVVVVIIVFT